MHSTRFLIEWDTPALRRLPVMDGSCIAIAMALAVEVITVGVRWCKSQSKNATFPYSQRLDSASELSYYVKCHPIKTQRDNPNCPLNNRKHETSTQGISSSVILHAGNTLFMVREGVGGYAQMARILKTKWVGYHGQQQMYFLLVLRLGTKDQDSIGSISVRLFFLTCSHN